MYKLLLVDDEQIIREGLKQMIDWEGLDITLTASCPNAIAALDSMMDDMPDILVTDVRMPGMDGLELVERAMSLHPRLRTIILSATTRSPMRSRRYAPGSWSICSSPAPARNWRRRSCAPAAPSTGSAGTCSI